MIDYILDRDNKTIRGWVINFVITMIYLVLIVWAVFDPSIKKSILDLQPVLTWFFTASFGIWTTKKIAEIVFDGKNSKISFTDPTTPTK
jgi:hypothetical protein